MSVDARTICTGAAEELGILQAGESLSAEDADFLLRKLNRMLGIWRTRKRFVYQIVSNAFTLSASQVSYTIGPSGGDFTLANGVPAKIERAYIVLTADDPDSKVPLRIIEVDQYADISIPAQTDSYSRALYYKRGPLLGTLYLWPKPTDTANQLELWTWTLLSTFATLDTSADLPDGYEEAITLSLAEACCGKAFGIELSGELQMQARLARRAIQSLNSSAPRLVSDILSPVTDWFSRFCR